MHTLLQAVAALLALAALLLLIPSIVLLLQVLVATLSRAPTARLSSLEPTDAARPTVAILVPAHDEATGILATLHSVLPQLNGGDRLLVVADNCSDDTAAIARRAGAEAVERTSETLRGKGYALDFGVRHLEAQPPDLVVIVDADCLLHPGALDRLTRRCLDTGAPVQALYLMHAGAEAALKARISEFAWLVRNEVRPLGMERMGLPCQLMGSGMALPWGLIRTAPLASGHIVEDMQLGIDLAAAGYPTTFCHDALVTSRFPERDAHAETQRTRWEHGHLSVITSSAAPLLWRAVRRFDARLLALVADLCVPPLVSLLVLQMGVLVAGSIFALVTGLWMPLAVAAVGFASVTLAVMVAWWRFGRGVVSAGDLMSVPAYILSKLPIYSSFFKKRQVKWVRTERDDKPR